jgi:glycosyltransferase involved in cell wall biosynthesis
MDDAERAPLTASVVVCVYNRAGQIGACLDSLLIQDLIDFEIILVDDGSTDATPAVLREYVAAHPGRPIRVLTNARNLGLSAARNVGIDGARGEIVCFTDSDCVVKPGWLQALVAGFTEAPVAAVAGQVEDAPARNLAELAYAGMTRAGQRSWQSRLVGNNMAIRRDLAARYRFDEALVYYCDEVDLARRLQDDGHQIGYAAGAVVCHDHPMTAWKYVRTGYLQGQGSARFWRKHRQLGRDVLPLFAAVLTLPLSILSPLWLFVPGVCLAVQLALIIYLEAALKGKPAGVVVRTLPLCFAYFCARAAGVLSILTRVRR